MRGIMKSARNEAQAFTLIELLVVIAAAVLVVAMTFPALRNAKLKAERIRCTSHLKQIGLGFRIFSTDNGDRYPMQIPASLSDSNSPPLPRPIYQYFASLSNELGTSKVLTCPTDRRRPATNWASLRNPNVSYFLGFTAKETEPNSLLSGDRNLATNGVAISNCIVDVSSNSVLSWTAEMHNDNGNVAKGDGSVHQWTSTILRTGLVMTNRLIIP
jgi:type II secretory pathway pseudopilin PulG